MFKRNLVVLTLALSFSSQALAFWGDSVPGPQPLIPPVKLLLASGGQFGPITLPQPLVPPAELLLTSGVIPINPQPYPFQDDLPMILASADMDKQLEGIDPANFEITMRELGDIIDTIYALDVLIKQDPKNLENIPSVQTTHPIALLIYLSQQKGYIELKTSNEILAMIASWYQ